MTNRDFRDLLAELSARDVRFLVVGGYAVTFHSRPRFTKDLDVWIDPTPDNARRVFDALAAFGSPLAAHGVQATDFATAGTVYQIGVPPNRIDVLTPTPRSGCRSVGSARCGATERSCRGAAPTDQPRPACCRNPGRFDGAAQGRAGACRKAHTDRASVP